MMRAASGPTPWNANRSSSVVAHAAPSVVTPAPMRPRTVAAFEVADIEAEIADLNSRGVEVEGVITLASGVRRAFFQDPDGNIIGMRQLCSASRSEAECRCAREASVRDGEL